MKKNTIVALADANYFPLLEELINSIKRLNEIYKILLDDAELLLEHRLKARDLGVLSLSNDIETAENIKNNIV